MLKPISMAAFRWHTNNHVAGFFAFVVKEDDDNNDDEEKKVARDFMAKCNANYNLANGNISELFWKKCQENGNI